MKEQEFMPESQEPGSKEKNKKTPRTRKTRTTVATRRKKPAATDTVTAARLAELTTLVEPTVEPATVDASPAEQPPPPEAGLFNESAGNVITRGDDDTGREPSNERFSLLDDDDFQAGIWDDEPPVHRPTQPTSAAQVEAPAGDDDETPLWPIEPDRGEPTGRQPGP
ncbi:MAG: hypothetical protein HRF43_20535, partial [Phycisphaerae bacterium]